MTRGKAEKPESPTLPGIVDNDTSVVVTEGAENAAEEIHPLEVAIKEYINSLESIAFSASVLMSLISLMHDDVSKDFDEVEKQAATKTKVDEKSYRLEFKETEAAVQARKINNLLGRMRGSFDLLPQAFIIAMVSQYDYLFSKVHRYLLTKNPDILEGSDRKLSFKDLSNFSSFEDARDSIIDKEVESLLRESHQTQVSKLETLLKIPLRAVTIWPEFIEIMERRNIFTHTKGVVSRQYLSVCAEHKVDLSGVKAGQALRADGKYVRRAHDVLFEMGVKLAYTVWKKLDRRSAPADGYLGEVGYQLLLGKRYDLASVMLEFAHGQKKVASDHTRKVYAINFANAHRLAGRTQKAQEIVDSVDWSSCDDKFKLGAAVIRGDYPGAARLMKQIGKDGGLGKLEYVEWPLFEGFRESQEFRQAFHDVFGEEYVKPRPLKKAFMDGASASALDETAVVEKSEASNQSA